MSSVGDKCLGFQKCNPNACRSSALETIVQDLDDLNDLSIDHDLSVCQRGMFGLKGVSPIPTLTLWPRSLELCSKRVAGRGVFR